MALSGPQAEQLTGAIADAFEVNDLVQMVRFKLGEDLSRHVNLAQPKGDVAYGLIAWSERVGWTDALIRAVNLTRPDNPAVVAFVDAHFAHLKTPVQPEQLVRSVQGGFAAAARRLADPAVRLIVERSRTNLEATRGQIATLNQYKALHDRLHTLQVRFLRPLADAADQFPVDGLPPAPLETYAYQLRREAEQAREEAQGLPTLAEELRWIEILGQRVIAPVETSLETRKPAPLRQAVTAFKRVLTEAPRIDSLLAATAAALGLDNLVEAMGAIAAQVQVKSSAEGGGNSMGGDGGGGGGGGDGVEDARAMRELSAGAEGLRELQPRIAGLVEEHFVWQWLDKEFTAAESLPGETPEERFPLWDEVSGRLSQLCALSPGKPWSTQLSKLVAELNALGAAPPAAAAGGDTNLFGRKFETFRTVARDRFFDVDAELLKLSSQLGRIADSIDQLLRVLTDDQHR